MLAFLCSFDLALTYASRRPRLALSLAWEALIAACKLNRPDLAYQANELIGVLS